DAHDPHARLRGRFDVLLDRERGIDDDRDALVRVADQVRAAPQVLVDELAEDHELRLTTGPARSARSVRFVAMAAREFFEGLEGRADPAKLGGLDHSYLFDIGGEGRWHVVIKDGKVTVTEGDAPADVTIRA